MLGLKLNHVSKRGHCRQQAITWTCVNEDQWCLTVWLVCNELKLSKRRSSSLFKHTLISRSIHALCRSVAGIRSVHEWFIDTGSYLSSVVLHYPLRSDNITTTEQYTTKPHVYSRENWCINDVKQNFKKSCIISTKYLRQKQLFEIWNMKLFSFAMTWCLILLNR